MAPVETLLRESALTYGHIQLFRDEAGWVASVCHYRSVPPQDGDTFTTGASDDPVDVLRKALIEDERRTRDLERKYAASNKGVPPVDQDGACTICEGGGCDACLKQIDIEDLIAEADPMAGMFG